MNRFALTLVSFAFALGLGCAPQVATASNRSAAVPDRQKLSTSSSGPTLHCNLEYETFQPSFQSGPIGDGNVALADLASGATISPDTTYSLNVSSNPSAPYNLSFNVNLLDGNGQVFSYGVLPAPDTAVTPYLFELGAKIPCVNSLGFDGQPHDFDHVRAYCSW